MIDNFVKFVWDSLITYFFIWYYFICFQIFTSTRKGSQHTALILAREARLVKNTTHKEILTAAANGVRDNKLRGNLMNKCIVPLALYHQDKTKSFLR